jgi:predicted Zn-dependent protease
MSFDFLCRLHQRTGLIALMILLCVGPYALAGTQAEELSRRAAAYLQSGQISTAAQLAKDAIEQSNTLDEQMRGHITLALIEAKQGKVKESQKRLQLVLTKLPADHSLAIKAQKALDLVSQSTAMQSWKASASQLKTTSMTQKDYYEYAITPQNVVHWNLARMPLKVYIQDPPTDFKQRLPNYQSFLLNGFNEWRKADPRLQFVVVKTEQSSDIRVKWKHTLEHSRIGESPSVIIGGKLVLADLVLATHLPNGQVLPQDILYHTITHEFGHVLGIHGHSPYAEDLMYWQVTGEQKGLTAKDIATLKRLYQTTPTYTNDASTSVAQSREDAKILLTAQLLFQNKRYTEALTKLAPLLAKNPKHKEAIIIASLCYANLNQYEKAANLYEKVVTVNDPNPLNVYNLAIFMIKRAELKGRSNVSYKTDVQKALVFLNKVAPQLEAPYKDQAAEAIQHCKAELQRIG